jgi:hypothetical protein
MFPAPPRLLMRERRRGRLSIAHIRAISSADRSHVGRARPQSNSLAAVSREAVGFPVAVKVAESELLDPTCVKKWPIYAQQLCLPQPSG